MKVNTSSAILAESVSYVSTVDKASAAVLKAVYAVSRAAFCSSVSVYYWASVKAACTSPCALRNAVNAASRAERAVA